MKWMSEEEQHMQMMLMLIEGGLKLKLEHCTTSPAFGSSKTQRSQVGGWW